MDAKLKLLVLAFCLISTTACSKKNWAGPDTYEITKFKAQQNYYKNSRLIIAEITDSVLPDEPAYTFLIIDGVAIRQYMIEPDKFKLEVLKNKKVQLSFFVMHSEIANLKPFKVVAGDSIRIKVNLKPGPPFH
jgi:hypothetical protein